jgi:hypothetical protein
MKNGPASSIACPACTFKAKQNAALERHLFTVHGVTAQALWNELNGGAAKCACGCGQTTQWYSWTRGYASVLRGHNANLIAVYGEERAAEISQKRVQSLKGKRSWAQGLTKETDERIAARGRATSAGRKAAFRDGKLIAWSKGLTQETDRRIAAAAAQLRGSYASGERVQWHSGGSSESDERIARKGRALSERFRTGELKSWHAGRTATDDPRIAKLWAARDPTAEYEHIRWSPSEIETMLSTNMRLRLEKIDGYRNDRAPAIHVLCSGCGWSQKVALVFARSDRCPRCDSSSSRAQSEIAAYAESLGFKVAQNVRGLITPGRQEIDVLVPERMFGVELNGLYWHSEPAGRDERYHADKTRRCGAVGIKLLHVFEDDWQHRRHIIESMIQHRLGRSQRTIHGRRCRIVEVAAARRRQFFEANHLDGDVAASACFGLELEGELVAALSLRRPFHRAHSARLEIARSCSIAGSSVRGGLSRLTKRAIEHARVKGAVGLITYVDGRVGSGSGYARAGMKKIGETPPRFWWTDFRERFNRFRFKANAAAGLSERQVAIAAGVVKIWGCTNSIWQVDC